MSMIPEGNYRAVADAESAEFGESKNGKPYLLVSFSIEGGEHDGRTLSRRFWLTDAAASRSVESLEYAGCTFADNDITNLTGLGRKSCEIVVAHERNDYTGTTYAEIKWVNAARSRGVRHEDKLGRDGLAALRERIRGTLAARRSGGGVPASTTGSASDPNDIPF